MTPTRRPLWVGRFLAAYRAQLRSGEDRGALKVAIERAGRSRGHFYRFYNAHDWFRAEVYAIELETGLVVPRKSA